MISRLKTVRERFSSSLLIKMSSTQVTAPKVEPIYPASGAQSGARLFFSIVGLGTGWVSEHTNTHTHTHTHAFNNEQVVDSNTVAVAVAAAVAAAVAVDSFERFHR